MLYEQPSRSITSVDTASTFESFSMPFPPWLRLSARIIATSLDLKLAAGQHPASSSLLAARSQQLASIDYRRKVAGSWLNLLVTVRSPHKAFDLAVPLVRSSVLEAEDEIRTLVQELVSPLPTVRGVAMSISLLRDGAGPLFYRASEINLKEVVTEIISLLNPLAPANLHS